MQRCLKNKTGQTPSLALIVAVTDGQTHHHTSVISTSSIFSAGLRWFCVGGGGAARTWAGNNYMACQLASWFSVWSIQTQTGHFIQGHGHSRGLRNALGMGFQPNFHSHTEELLFWIKCETQQSCQAESLTGTRVTIALKASFTAKAWGWKQETLEQCLENWKPCSMSWKESCKRSER